MIKVIGLVARMVYGKKILEIVDGINERMVGSRTEILVVLVAAVALLQHTGLLDQQTSATIITALLGAVPVTLANKVSNYLDQVDSVLPPPPTVKPGPDTKT